jgi:8-oxo-dGTP diphosphatase
MNDPTSRVVDVAVGVIERPDGQVLLACRPQGRPYAGYWEFPGGKVEPGETIAQAMARELHEELGLTELSSTPWIVVGHTYPHATVRLFFRRVRAWQGEPESREGQTLAWRSPMALDLQPLLPASIEPIRWLSLPAIYRISCASLIGVQAFERALDALLHEAPASQPVWVQLREPDLPEQDFSKLFERLIALRSRLPLKLIVSSRHPKAFWERADGVHLTSRDLAAMRARPALPWVGASCHDRADLDAAASLGCDFAVFGPVAPTDSHPGAPTLGFDALGSQLSLTRLPVYALGGMKPADLPAARQAGAHGVAIMRAAWA